MVDGAIKTACQQACPTNAIMFGDLNDESSEVSKWRNSERNFFLLEELGIKPTVSYLVKVRNQEEPMHHQDMERHGTDADHNEEKHEEKHS